MLSCLVPALFQIYTSACSTAPRRSMSAIHLNSRCSNMSKYFWQKWLTTKTDAGLSAFLRPKDAQKIEQNKGVTEMSESRFFFSFSYLHYLCKPTLLYSISFLRSLLIKNVCNHFKFVVVLYKSKSLFPSLALSTLASGCRNVLPGNLQHFLWVLSQTQLMAFEKCKTLWVFLHPVTVSCFVNW